MKKHPTLLYVLVCKVVSKDNVGAVKGQCISADTAGSSFQNRRLRPKKSWGGGLYRTWNDTYDELLCQTQKLVF